jgi:hypothetical protein
MPSGITSDIYEGKDVTLQDYLLRVGRSMSFAIMQRDSDVDEPVKYREPSTKYDEERIAKAQAEIVELEKMTLAEAAQRSTAEYNEKMKAREEYKANKEALLQRYENMLAKVKAWEPDEKIAYVKKYAIQYLEESIEFDVGDRSNLTKYYPYPMRLNGSEWLNDKTQQARETIDRARKNIKEELDRVKDFNEHIDAFLKSLPND